MSSNLSVPEQIRQLNDARKLVLGDVKYYPSVVRGILPIIGPAAPIELRRWGTDFLAEAFATPALPNSEKETMQPYVLTTLESLAESEVDAQVLRSVIQTAASIYPVALRWIINNGYDTVTWERMVSIKQRILRIWENAPPTVGICCIKFAQRVILAQSVSTGNEQRYGGGLDVSLDKIPPNHQTLDPRTLEAEANGLLDRMLYVFSGSSDAVIVDATLNCMSIMVRTRPATSSRILNALLAFNPLQAASSPLSSKTKVMIRSMEKTARLLLLHLSKRDPHHPLVPRIQQHVESTMRMVAELFDTRKRPLEPAAANEPWDAKRQRVDAKQIQIPALGPGPHSLADVFTLIGSSDLKNFDISQVPTGLVARIAVSTLTRLDAQILARAVDGVRDRLDALNAEPAPELNPNTAPLGVEEDEDDYEPDFYQAEDTEQILNQLDNAPATVATEPPRAISLDDTLGLRAFSLPQPSQLTPEAALSAGAGTVTRVLEMMKSLEEPAPKRHRAGFNRLAASSESRDSWMTILARLATRASAGLEEAEEEEERVADNVEKSEVKGRPAATKMTTTATTTTTLSQSIREMLYNYVMEDFRKHIDVAVSWLCEEWYNDRLQRRAGGDRPAHYEACALRLIDGFLPYLHPQDKVLTRFLSEIPELSRPILGRVKHMCRDPSVVPLALTSLLYLVIMRPPIKEVALDTVQDIWTECEFPGC
ncbi:mRNA cleavage and polyadenylation specificity factor complex subunit pta1 [Escovopsis weberi]|uniref:mRNA cleavage and polyadenylation specificity factor complex subunit pta1 n=1 Tax=Escovopsis weberi TaxID=150374 RepID=A0A0M9VTD3_ESCWE|nr:mRNA cleavage and polyadenylation specificity factor complex subunit pta1 [Escovopsis weberi]